ncbi:O-antigen ligase family protein [Ureibacillus chungkukjangi]|uniref:O-antigen ligase family protein n=1 Tax=Ureibacillus chungkukjangi TaxID=1202712 RepID=UPI003850A3FB
MKFDVLSYFLIFYISIYIFSVVVNLVTYSFGFERILATLNTISIWIVALFYYLVYKTEQIDLQAIQKISFYNYIGLIGLWMVSQGIYFVTGIREISISDKVLYYTEWFSGTEVVRFVGLMEYPNLIIMFCLFFYPLFCKHALGMERYWASRFLIVLGLLPIISTYSRSGYLVIVIGLAALLLFYLHKYLDYKKIVVIYTLSLATVITAFFYTDLSESFMTNLLELFSAREGSNDSRTFLMVESIRIPFENSPIIGMGIKDRSAIGYPLGSHSTFIGFMYKTGILGVLLGTIVFIIITLKIISAKENPFSKMLTIFMLIMPIVFLVEDIDGSNWLIVFYFIFVALLIKSNRIFFEKE